MSDCPSGIFDLSLSIVFLVALQGNDTTSNYTKFERHGTADVILRPPGVVTGFEDEIILFDRVNDRFRGLQLIKHFQRFALIVVVPVPFRPLTTAIAPAANDTMPGCLPNEYRFVSL